MVSIEQQCDISDRRGPGRTRGLLRKSKRPRKGGWVDLWVEKGENSASIGILEVARIGRRYRETL